MPYLYLYHIRILRGQSTSKNRICNAREKSPLKDKKAKQSTRGRFPPVDPLAYDIVDVTPLDSYVPSIDVCRGICDISRIELKEKQKSK